MRMVPVVGLLVCLVASLEASAQARLRRWPGWSTRQIKLGPDVVAVRREWYGFGRIITRPLICRGPGPPRVSWGWRVQRSRFTLYSAAGKRLAPYRYTVVGATTDSLAFGVRPADGRKPLTTQNALTEYVDATGNLTPVAETGLGKLWFQVR